MKTWNNLIRAGVGALFAMLLISPAAFGQLGKVSRYTVSTETGTWIDATSGGTKLGAQDDTWWHFNLPFDIVYDSTTVASGTSVSMEDDGDLLLGNYTNSASYCTDQLANSSFPGDILPFNIDWNFTAGGSCGDYWSVTGSSPNRTLTVEWYEDDIFGTSTQSSFEIQIHETSGVIEFLYADHSLSTGTSDCGHGAYVGLNGMTTPATDYVTAASAVTSTPSTDFKFTPPLNRPPGELSLIPKTLNFGTATPNSPDTLCATAYNVGSATIHIQAYGVGGSSAYSIVSAPAIGDSILVGQSKTFCFQFLPLSGGSLTGSFALQTDAKDSGTQSVNFTGFGAVPGVTYGATNLFHRTFVKLGDTSAPQYIPVTSSGGGPLHFNSVYFIGLNGDNYFVSHMPPNPLPAGVTDSIGIQFAPTLEGRPDAQAVISTDAANKPLDTVALFGVGTLPHLVITVQPPGMGNTVSFDSVALGDSVCQAITLTNTGSDTLFILKQLVTYGDYDFTFNLLKAGDTMILPGVSKPVNICFKPLKNGTRVASVRFYTSIPLTFEKPQRDTSQFPINVIGIGVPFGQLAALGRLTDTAIVGKTNCITDTLINNGLANLTVTKVTIAGPDSTAFTLSGAATPFTLKPGGMQIVQLCFTASARGTQFDTLLLSGTTAEKSFLQQLFLQGVGVISCVSADSLITFGVTSMTPVGAVDTSCITVTNCGDVSATYTISAPTGASYTLLPPMTSGVVAAGNTARFCVVFTPTAIGAASGSVTITGGPFPATTLLGGVGAGVAATALGAPAAPVATDTCNSFDVTITNTGIIPWTPGTGSIGGTNGPDFTIVSGPTPATIAPNGGTATVTINFCPKTVGTESMTLTFPGESPTPVAGAFSFTTTGVGAQSGVTIRTEQDGFSLGQSFPNPTNGTADVTVTLPHDASVRIDLIDATGQVMKTAFSGNLAAGSQSIQLGCKGLPSGTYFYTLTSGNVRLARQLILVK